MLSGPVVSLFGRGDIKSGISTDVLNAPEPYWRDLYERIASGQVKPSASGWAFLQSVKGVTPQAIGGAAPAQAQAVGGAAPGGPGGGPGGGVQDAYASMAASAAAEQAARQAYQAWMMRTGDERLAFEKAQQEWANTFQQKQFEYSQQRGAEQQALAVAGLTGQYQGAPTLAAQQQAFAQQLAQQQFGLAQQAQAAQTGLGVLGLQASLRGPANYAQYLQTLGQTPQGLRDLLGGLAGQYRIGASAGAAGGTTPASLGTLTQDLLAPGGQGGQPSWQQYQEQTKGLPAPNQINLQNWGNLTPTGQALALNAYEAQGWRPEDVAAALKAASPRYVFGGA
jgi:hypothetical protein